MSNEDHHKQEQQTIARYEASNGEDAGDGWLEGLPLVILTTRGRKSGEPRKVVLTRCLHEGVYAVVGSGPDPIGGTPTYSQWYLNLVADPHVTVRDRTSPLKPWRGPRAQKKKSSGGLEFAAVWPDYEQYQANTTKDIPVVLLSPSSPARPVGAPADDRATTQ